MSTERIKGLIDRPAILLALLVGVIQVGLTAVIAYRGWGPPDTGPPFPPPEEWHWGPSPMPSPDWGPSGPPWQRPDTGGRPIPPDALGYLLLAAGPVALAFRRRFPTPVLLVAVGSVIGYLLLGYSYGPVALAAVVALVSAVGHGARRAAWLIGLGGLATHWLLQYLIRGDFSWAGVIGSIAWTLVFLLVAEAIRSRKERAEAARQAQAQQARRIADEERLRIARELHDVLAHNISLINVQAGVALHLAEELPEPTRAALQAIKDASRETLRELRHTLGVLRGVDEQAPREPAPSLDRIDELLARAAVPVHKEVVGTPQRLPAGVDLAAYRIIQEALTNVHRHAAASMAWVRLEYAPDRLVVTIEDDGRGAPQSTEGTGSGIAGMTERATALGGTLHAGPRPGGGFRVHAVLPLPDDPAKGEP